MFPSIKFADLKILPSQQMYYWCKGTARKCPITWIISCALLFIFDFFYPSSSWIKNWWQNKMWLWLCASDRGKPLITWFLLSSWLFYAHMDHFHSFYTLLCKETQWYPCKYAMFFKVKAVLCHHSDYREWWPLKYFRLVFQCHSECFTCLINCNYSWYWFILSISLWSFSSVLWHPVMVPFHAMHWTCTTWQSKRGEDKDDKWGLLFCYVANSAEKLGVRC